MDYFWNMTFFVGFKTFSLAIYLFSSCQFGQHNVYYPIRSTPCFHGVRMFWLHNLRGLVLNLARQMKRYQILRISLMYPFSQETIRRARKGGGAIQQPFKVPSSSEKTVGPAASTLIFSLVTSCISSLFFFFSSVVFEGGLQQLLPAFVATKSKAIDNRPTKNVLAQKSEGSSGHPRLACIWNKRKCIFTQQMCLIFLLLHLTTFNLHCQHFFPLI